LGRHPTAIELALDVKRSLAQEPIEASLPWAIDPLRKFLRRNESQVAAASLLVPALVARIAFGRCHNRQLDRTNCELLAAGGGKEGQPGCRAALLVWPDRSACKGVGREGQVQFDRLGLAKE
jgi:hypothetical protein